MATDLSCLLTLLPGQAVGLTWFWCLWCDGIIVCIPDGVEATVTSGVVATIEFSVHKPFVLAGPKRPHIGGDPLAQVCSLTMPVSTCSGAVSAVQRELQLPNSLLLPSDDLLSQVDFYVVAGLFKVQWILHSWNLIISCNLSLLLFTTTMLTCSI